MVDHQLLTIKSFSAASQQFGRTREPVFSNSWENIMGDRYSTFLFILIFIFKFLDEHSWWTTSVSGLLVTNCHTMLWLLTNPYIKDFSLSLYSRIVVDRKLEILSAKQIGAECSLSLSTRLHWQMHFHFHIYAGLPEQCDEGVSLLHVHGRRMARWTGLQKASRGWEVVKQRKRSECFDLHVDWW